MADLLEPPLTPISRPVERARCTRYTSGHNPHYIQVRLCLESPPDHWIRGVLMGVLGDVVTFAVGEELRRYRNHEAGYLAAVVTQVGAEAQLNVRYRALFLRPWPDDGARRAVFCLQDAAQDPLTCTPPT